MKSIVYSTLPFLHLTPLKAVKECLAIGADKVEVFMEGPSWSRMTDEMRRDLADELLQLPCQYSVHPPQFDLNLASDWQSVREAAIEEYKKAIHFAGLINASHIVIDPGYRHLPLSSLKEARESAKRGIESLLTDAERWSVLIGIENGPVTQKLLFNEEEYVAFVKSFNHPMIGAVLDTGHARLAKWDISGVIDRLGVSLLAVHLNDTSGRVDNHLPLGSGVIEWKKVFQALKYLTYEPDLVLELNTETSPEALRESSDYIQSFMRER
ncbi:MAG: sugar phosphate isomerase/epimerase [Alkalibacterium sp.]|nr:sugar phosphate isomerase/epimerase [Alkalibacterium sp.]TVP90848.1 MAG: sugar phosphate isomerase/epimerase [Alkalibacterium sp.]